MRRLPWRRVTLVAVVAAALAVGTFLLLRQLRLDASADEAVGRGREAIETARQNLPEAPGNPRLQRLVDDLVASDQNVLIRASRGRTFASVIGLDLQDVPDDLERLVRRGSLAFQRATVDDEPVVVVGGRVRQTEIYLMRSEAELREGIIEMGVLLGAGWLVVMAVTLLVLLTFQARMAAMAAARERERRFTADVAHELRTPLAALVAEAGLLREQLDAMPEESRRPAELMVGDVARLRRLVDDLMEISRLDSGRETVEPRWVDLGELARTVISARGWDRQVAVEGPDDGLEDGGLVLLTDPRRIERVVANLVGNAIEHGGRGVRVRVGRDARGAVLEVTDEGPGMPRGALPQLFERFAKGDPARSAGGSGLGLAIAMENARLIGAEIDAWSEPDRGARFTLRLPERLPGRRSRSASAHADEVVADREPGRP
jgi:signal transduction histidine kinase